MSSLAEARQQFPHLSQYSDQELLDIVASQNKIAPGTPRYDQLKSQLLGYDRTKTEATADAGLGLVQGTLGLAKPAAMAMGRQFGKIVDSARAAREALGMDTTGMPTGIDAFNNPASAAVDSATNWVNQFKSQGLRNREAGQEQASELARQEAEAAGAGKWGQIGAEAKARGLGYVGNPQLLAQDAIANVPQLLGPAVVAKGAQGAALAANLSAKAALRAGVAGGVGSGAVLQGTDVASDTYQRLRQAGASNEQAADLAAEAGVKGGLVSVAVNALPFGSTIEKSLLAGAGTKKILGSGLATRVVAGAVEAGTEAVEEGYGKYANNQAMQVIDPNTNMAQGIGSAAVQGAAVGGPLGALTAHPHAPARTETGEIDLTARGPRTGANPLDVPAYERRGLDPLNERSSPWAPTPAAPAPTTGPAVQGDGTIVVTPDGTALPAQNADQMARTEQMRSFNDGIPTLNDQLAPADGIPVLNDRVHVPEIPTLTDQLAPADGIPVLTDQVDVPGTKPSRGKLLATLNAAAKEVDAANPVRKDGQLATTKANAQLAQVMAAPDPAAAIRELHQDGGHPRDELLDAWHKQLTGETAMEAKAKAAAPTQTVPVETPVTPPQIVPTAPVAAALHVAADPAPVAAAPATVEAPAPVAPAPVEAPAPVAPAPVAPAPVAAQPVAAPAAPTTDLATLEQAESTAFDTARNLEDQRKTLLDARGRQPRAGTPKGDQWLQLSEAIDEAKANWDSAAMALRAHKKQAAAAAKAASAEAPTEGAKPKKEKAHKFGRKSSDELVDIADNTKDDGEYTQARYELYKRWAEDTDEGVAEKYLTDKENHSALSKDETRAFELRYQEELKAKGEKKGQKLGEKFGSVKPARAGNPDVGQSRAVPVEGQKPTGVEAARWLRDNAQRGEDRMIAGKIAQFLDGVDMVWVREGVEVPEQVADVLNANGRGASALNQETGKVTVYVREDIGAFEDVVLHELVHAATQNALENPANADVRTELESLRAKIKNALSREAYNMAHNSERAEFGQFFMRAVDDAHELLAYAYASPTFRSFLQSIDASGNSLRTTTDQGYMKQTNPTALQRLVNMVRGMLGMPPKFQARFETIITKPAGTIEGESVFAQLDKGFDAILNANKATGTGTVSANKTSGRPLATFSVAFKKWFGDSKVVDASGDPLVLYRGLYGPASDTTTMAPRSDYAVFASTSPHVASTYANLDHQVPSYRPHEHFTNTGAVYPVYVSASKVIEFPVGKRFDMFEFDRQAKNLKPGEALVARGVYDSGPRATRFTDPGEMYSHAADTWAFGKGTSIKSATGNNGDFDGTNPDIRANKSAITAPFANAAREVAADVRAQTSGKEVSSKLLSLLTLRQIEEQFGAKLPALRNWIGAIMERSSNASKVAAEADRVALQWEQSVKSKAERVALADVLLRASVAELELGNVKPEYLKTLSPEERAEHTALRAKLDSLSPEARRTREQALAVLKRQWDYTRSALESFINHTVADPELRNARIEQLKQEMGRNRGDYFPLARFGERIVIGRGAAADGQDVVSFHETAASAEAARQDLERQGVKHVEVTMKTKYDPKERASSQFMQSLHGMIDGSGADSATIDAMHEALQQLFLKSLPEMSGAKAMIRRENIEGFSKDALRVFADSVSRGARYASQLEYAPMIQAAKEAAEAQAGSSGHRHAAVVIGTKDGEAARVMVVPVGTDRLNAVKRMADEGYAATFSNVTPETAKEALAKSLVGATDAEIATHVAKVEQVVGRTTDGVEDLRAAKQLYNHMVELQSNQTTEKPGAVIEALGQAGYVWFLGFSPAFWAMNMMQNVMVGVPQLGARYGTARAGKEMMGAAKWFSKVRIGKAIAKDGTPFAVEWLKEEVKAGRLEGVSKDELDMLQTLEDRQVLDFTQAMDLTRIGQASSSKRYKFMRAAAAMAHHTEVFNRVTFALAAYRLAMRSDGNVTKADAIRRAEDDTVAAHFDYSASNKPGLMRGQTSLIFMFQQYRQHMLYWWAKNAKDLVKNEAPGDRTQAAKAMLLMGTTHALFAGALGMPFMGAVALLANLIGGDDDDGVPFDFNQWISDAAKEQLGETAGAAMANGIFAAMGMNIGKRIGQQDLLPFLNEGGSAKYERNTDDKFRAYMFDLMGPLGSIGLGVARSLDAFKEGDVTGGIAAMAPKFAADIAKAVQLDSDGLKDKKGLTIATREAFDGSDVLLQGLGVVPTKLADIKAKHAKVTAVEAQVQARSRHITDNFVEAWLRGDREEMTAALADVQSFNKKVADKYHDQKMLIDSAHLENAIKDRQTKQLLLALTGGTAETKRQIMIANQTSGLFEQSGAPRNTGGTPGLPGLPGLPR